ncbi:MAG: hypothetical protein WBF17_13075 [Phycisphaerae bacterium]
MTRLRTAPTIGVFLCASCLAGCDKEVELTFVNLTGDSLDVHLTSPREGRQYLGVIAPMGKLDHELEVDKDELPTTCTWSAGPYRGRFPVTKDTQEELRIEISPVGESRTRDKGTGLSEDFTVPGTPTERRDEPGRN